MGLLRHFKSNIYNKWSPTTKIFFWLAVAALIIGPVLFFYSRSSDRTYFDQQFFETQELCSKDLRKCSSEETQHKLSEYNYLIDDFYIRAKRAAEGGHYNEARYFYDHISKTDSNYTRDDDFWYEYALILEYQVEYGSDFEAYKAASEALKKAIEINESNLRAMNELGLTYHMMGKQDRNFFFKAIEIYNKVLEKDTTNLDALMGKVYVFKYLGDMKNFEDTLKLALKHYPYHIEVLTVFSFYLLENERFDECFSLLDQINGVPEESFPSYERFLRIKIARAICMKEVGLSKNDLKMINVACDELDKIQSNIELDKLHYNEEERKEAKEEAGITVTLQTPNNCDGYLLLQDIEFMKIAPDMGRCDDPYDKTLDNKC